jgi:hypothetical protein
VPFKNFDAATREIFNFVYTKANVTIFIKTGTGTKMHIYVMPSILLNLDLLLITTYGDNNKPRPFFYMTDTEYLWPRSTWFSIVEENNNYVNRLNRGDWTIDEM